MKPFERYIKSMTSYLKDIPEFTNTKVGENVLVCAYWFELIEDCIVLDLSIGKTVEEAKDNLLEIEEKFSAKNKFVRVITDEGSLEKAEKKIFSNFTLSPEEQKSFSKSFTDTITNYIKKYSNPFVETYTEIDDLPF